MPKVIQVEGKAPTVKPISSLVNHQHSVNVVRFSPGGNALLSGGDKGELLLWAPVEEGRSRRPSLGSSGGNKASGLNDDEGEERWKYRSTLRGHHSDVNDVSWSPDGTAVVSGSVENIAMLWDVSDTRVQVTLSDHKHFVQVPRPLLPRVLTHPPIILSNAISIHIYQNYPRLFHLSCFLAVRESPGAP